MMFWILLYMAVQTLTSTSLDFLHNIQHLDYIKNTTDYWPFVTEYLKWNAAVAALQFWTADLEAHVLSSTIEQVYNAFVYTISTQLLCQQSEEVLFGHFMTMCNATFESKLTLEDEGYEGGSESGLPSVTYTPSTNWQHGYHSPKCPRKLQDTSTSIHHKVLKFIKVNISLHLRKLCLRTGKSLAST